MASVLLIVANEDYSMGLEWVGQNGVTGVFTASCLSSICVGQVVLTLSVFS